MAVRRELVAELRQRWDVPSRPRSIVFIGSGGIVNDAHLPAYRALGFDIAGCFDQARERAEQTAARWKLPRVFGSLGEAASQPGVVFDVALPPEAVFETLQRLPDGAVALIQKPLGLDLADATRIRAVCRAKKLVAAVNFQLRFSPAMLALADAVERGLLGRLIELEVHVNCRMPWELWPFMAGLKRMEFALHSIHYLDSIRRLLGEPRSVQARTVKHPDAPWLASSRSTAILDYADDVRCALSINHHHKHGPKHQTSRLRVEGTLGAAVLTMGVNLDYPRGRPDELELAFADPDARRSEEWHAVPLCGNWFPDAFRGTMSNLQRFAAGEDRVLLTSVEDAWHTMALVEALYAADARGGVPIPSDASVAGEDGA
ncbi:MAG: Gfo/Idh/MocA family oxidoreductase [Planctomycetes bacterium]|nr:Gfo/Idh/MocA family oxidoreductase [Planctomycetota bacterium]